MSEGITFSTDPDAMDYGFIAGYLANESYWARGRTEATVRQAARNSFCMGLFVDGRQMAFARAVTDYVTYAYVMDVIVRPDCQGLGYGSRLLRALMVHPRFAQLKGFTLRTQDAGGFYEKLGFVAEPVVLYNRKASTAPLPEIESPRTSTTSS
jgi:ribosomal protein S18 acetylase RimI-like enzyme